MIFTKYIYIGISFLVLISNALSAQLSIERIQIEGLKKTKESYINRFIDSKLGSFADEALLAADLQRLKNLSSIADGNIVLDTVETDVHIRFQLKEALTLFPILNFGGVQGNFWYQVGFDDDNWRGLGRKLTVSYQNNDGRDNFNLYYKVPSFSRSRWGGSLSVSKWASIEPLFFENETVYYNYDNLSLGLSAIYQIKRNNTLEVGVTSFIENYIKDNRHEGLATPGPESLEQPKLLGKLIHYRNALKYHLFYLSGFDNTASLQTVFNLQDRSWFHIFLNDTRYFKRLPLRGNLAARLRVGVATNNNSPFAPFVLDSYVNIRGSGNRIERGTAALILNLEYRQTVFESAKFGAQIVAFSDAGTWRNPGGKLSDLLKKDNLQHFVGGGIRVIYNRAYNAILRLDYGIDIRQPERRGVVIGIGQYF